LIKKLGVCAYQAESRTGGRLIIVLPEFNGRGGGLSFKKILCFASKKLVLFLGLDTSCFVKQSNALTLIGVIRRK
jgi:hypothetical protein